MRLLAANDPLLEKFHNSFPKESVMKLIHILRSNFKETGR